MIKPGDLTSCMHTLVSVSAYPNLSTLRYFCGHPSSDRNKFFIHTIYQALLLQKFFSIFRATFLKNLKKLRFLSLFIDVIEM